MMLHRHFEKREEKPAEKPVGMKVQEGHDIVNAIDAPVETEEPAKRGRKRKAEE